MKIQYKMADSQNNTIAGLPKTNYKYKDYRNFATKENYAEFCQLCDSRLSELSDEEMSFIMLANAVFTVNMERSYKGFQRLKNKTTFLIGDEFLSSIMYLADKIAKYGQDGVLAYAKADDFQSLKNYHFYMNPKNNTDCKKDDKVLYYEILAKGYSKKSLLYQILTTLQRAVLIERNSGISELQQSHHQKERHNFIDLAAEYDDDHIEIHNKSKAENQNIFYKKNFLPDIQERLGFTDTQLCQYIKNLNLLKDLFGYCNAVYTDLDLTEDISYMSLNELFKHTELY